MSDDMQSSEKMLNGQTKSEAADLRTQLLKATDRHSHAFLPLENLLGLAEGFVKELIEEKDDWAFIIKIAVIVEATLGKVINAYLQNPLIERHIQVIPMDGRSGKIQLARDLGIIGPKSMARLRAMAEIRNDFAHSLGVVQLSIGKYLSRLTDTEASALWAKLFAVDANDNSSKNGKPKKTAETDSADSDYSVDGRVLIYSAAWLALSELAMAYRHTSNDAIWRSALVELGEAFLCRQQGDEGSARKKMKVALDKLTAMAEAPFNRTQESFRKKSA